MKTEEQIGEMAEQAKLAAGWGEEGFVSLGRGAGEAGLDRDEGLQNRAYAEGVEAGLRWAMGWAGNPFPR